MNGLCIRPINCVMWRTFENLLLQKGFLSSNDQQKHSIFSLYKRVFIYDYAIIFYGL